MHCCMPGTRFPPVPEMAYDYPRPEELFGQSMACVSVRSQAFDSCVARALAIENINKYSSHFPRGLKERFPNLAKAFEGENNNHEAEADASVTCSFSTSMSGSTALRVFAKSRNWGKSIFRQFVQPFYGAAMIHQSWRRGRGGAIPSCCVPECSFDDINVAEINIRVRQWLFQSADPILQSIACVLHLLLLHRSRCDLAVRLALKDRAPYRH